MGLVKEIPGLQIDDFCTHKDCQSPALVLLTHAHSDHLQGLERPSYYGPTVWCSFATRSLVLNLRTGGTESGQLKYNHLRKEVSGVELIRGLEMDVPHVLKCNELTVQVTLINAYHCPGSTMFLLQTNTVAVLYTGDIRCEQWHINYWQHHPALIPYTLAGESIKVYADNVYEDHNEDSLEYLPSRQSIPSLLSDLDKYSRATPLCALFTTTGYEEILVALATKFKTKVHLDSYQYQLYAAAADNCPLSRALIDVSTTQKDLCRIHWCRKNGDCPERARKDAVFFSPCVTISSQAVAERNRPLSIKDFDVVGNCDRPAYISVETGARYVLAPDGDTLLPGHILFYFSRHASGPGLEKLIQVFCNASLKSLDGGKIRGFSPLKSDDTQSTQDGNLPTCDLPKTLPVFRKRIARRKPVKRRRPSQSSTSSKDDMLEFLNLKANSDTSSRTLDESMERHSTQEDSLKDFTTERIRKVNNTALEGGALEAGRRSSSFCKALENELKVNANAWFSLQFDWEKPNKDCSV